MDVKWENGVVTNVPIACTLTAEAVVDRLAEWSAAFSTLVEKVDFDGNHATLTLHRGSEALLTIADLAQREKACCPFFQFSIELEGIDMFLHVEVPHEADQILTELLSLLPPNLRPH